MSEWASYLARGAFLSGDNQPLYHMCDVSLYNAMTSNTEAPAAAGRMKKLAGHYYPPSYDQDGFVHATAKPSFLLEVANHFYVSAPGDWICLELDARFLGSEVKLEPAAPVGTTAAFAKGDENVELFPHIFGGIPKLAVKRTFKINRSADGHFLNIEGLV